jgi:hypothetical protein
MKQTSQGIKREKHFGKGGELTQHKTVCPVMRTDVAHAQTWHTRRRGTRADVTRRRGTRLGVVHAHA